MDKLIEHEQETGKIATLARYLEVIRQTVDRSSTQQGHYIYRGQSNAGRTIRSSALHRILLQPLKFPALAGDLFMGYIHQIIDEIQLRYASTFKDISPLECMAYLQHHRVATGLIDFTYSPLVALWFACEKTEGADGKVFVVDARKAKEIKARKSLDKKEMKDFFVGDGQWHLWQPSIGNPTIDTERIKVQQSVFLFGAPEVKQDMIAKEIVISGKDKRSLLHELETAGVSERTLFPDMLGFFERNAAKSPYDLEKAEHYYTQQIEDGVEGE